MLNGNGQTYSKNQPKKNRWTILADQRLENKYNFLFHVFAIPLLKVTETCKYQTALHCTYRRQIEESNGNLITSRSLIRLFTVTGIYCQMHNILYNTYRYLSRCNSPSELGQLRNSHRKPPEWNMRLQDMQDAFVYQIRGSGHFTNQFVCCTDLKVFISQIVCALLLPCLRKKVVFYNTDYYVNFV